MPYMTLNPLPLDSRIKDPFASQTMKVSMDAVITLAQLAHLHLFLTKACQRQFSELKKFQKDVWRVSMSAHVSTIISGQWMRCPHFQPVRINVRHNRKQSQFKYHVFHWYLDLRLFP